jgi:hypothetical protein
LAAPAIYGLPLLPGGNWHASCLQAGEAGR